jgi:hypothetical protein
MPMHRSKAHLFAAFVAVPAFVAALSGTARAQTSCNVEGDTCISLQRSGSNQLTVDVTAFSGDYRNIRLTINGVFQGQWEETDGVLVWNNPQQNALYEVDIQSCWRGFWGSTCHTWASQSISVLPSGGPSGGRILAGAGLVGGQTAFSYDHRYDLELGFDGNLVLFEGATVIWQSFTPTHPGALALMQDDGNFVLYDKNGVAYFSTGTWGNPGSLLDVQDGSFAIFDGLRTLFQS